jgi:hypothetical protein
MTFDVWLCEPTAAGSNFFKGQNYIISIHFLMFFLFWIKKIQLNFFGTFEQPTWVLVDFKIFHVWGFLFMC